MWTGQYLWGYLMTGHRGVPDAAGAARRGALARHAPHAHARAVGAGRARRLLAAAVAGRHARPDRAGRRGAALVARGASGRRSGLLAVPAAVALPALYYFALSVFDPAWELASESNAAGSQATWSWPWWAIALTVAPLAAAGRARLPHARARLAVSRRAGLAVRRAARLPPAHRHVPLPLVPGARDPALDPRRAGRAERLAAPAAGARGGRAGADDRARHRPQGRGGGEQRAGGGRPVLRLRRRAARARRARGRPAPGRRARARLRRPHAAVQDRARGVRGRALVDARLGGAGAGDAARCSRPASRPSGPGRSCGGAARVSSSWTAGPGLRDLEADLRPLLEDVRRYGCATVYVLRRHAGTAAVPK